MVYILVYKGLLAFNFHLERIGLGNYPSHYCYQTQWASIDVGPRIPNAGHSVSSRSLSLLKAQRTS